MYGHIPGLPGLHVRQPRPQRLREEPGVPADLDLDDQVPELLRGLVLKPIRRRLDAYAIGRLGEDEDAIGHGIAIRMS